MRFVEKTVAGKMNVAVGVELLGLDSFFAGVFSEIQLAVRNRIKVSNSEHFVASEWETRQGKAALHVLLRNGASRIWTGRSRSRRNSCGSSYFCSAGIQVAVRGAGVANGRRGFGNNPFRLDHRIAKS